MGILGLGDHVANIRPEDINGKTRETANQVSSSKKTAWGHLLVAAITLIKGSSASEMVLRRVALPECSSCVNGGNDGCADMSFYKNPFTSMKELVINHESKPYIHVHQKEIDEHFVCQSLNPQSIKDGNDYTYSAQLDPDNCYREEDFEQFLRSRLPCATFKTKQEVHEQFLQRMQEEVNDDFIASRRALDDITASQSSATVILPSPTPTFLGAVTNTLLSASPTGLPAIR